MKTLNDSPARYATQLAETIGSLHRHLAAEQPDWWRQVVAGLHSQLDEAFPLPSWKGGDTPKAPDWLPGMEYARINALEERLGTIESLASAYRLNALEERLSALEDWADIELEPVDDTPPDSIHNLIAEGMTGVTADCEARLAAAVAPLLARLDALENRAPC